MRVEMHGCIDRHWDLLGLGGVRGLAQQVVGAPLQLDIDGWRNVMPAGHVRRRTGVRRGPRYLCV